MKLTIQQPGNTNQIGPFYLIVGILALLLVSCALLSPTQATPVATPCVNTPPLTTAEVAQIFEQNIKFDVPAGWKEIHSLSYERRIGGNIGLLNLLAFRTSSSSPKECAIEMMRMGSSLTPLDSYVGNAHPTQISGLETYTLVYISHTPETNSPVHSLMVAFSDKEYVYLFSLDVFADGDAFLSLSDDVMSIASSIKYLK